MKDKIKIAFEKPAVPFLQNFSMDRLKRCPNLTIAGMSSQEAATLSTAQILDIRRKQRQQQAQYKRQIQIKKTMCLLRPEFKKKERERSREKIQVKQKPIISEEDL